MTEKYLTLEIIDQIAVLKLNRSVTNPLNLEMVEQLRKKIRELQVDPAINGLVLTSESEKFFSIGFDIPALFPLDKSLFQNFFHQFNQLSIELYSFPKPSVAAILGHAIAGGCILTLCCDYRFIASGKKFMGLNEKNLGIPVPYPIDCILRDLVNSQNAREITYSGDFYLPERLIELNLVDKQFPQADVLNNAIELLQRI